MQNVLTKRLDTQTREMWEVNKYLWISLAFALIYIFVARARNMLLTPIWVLWLLLGLGIVNGAARSYVGYRSGGTTALIGWAKIFTALDILLIACAIAVTGGLKSDLWLLFFVAMISESLYAGSTQTVIVSSGIATAYCLATLPPQILVHKMDWLEFVTTLGARLFFLIVVGTYGRRISYTAEERNREVMLLHEEMATGEERARIAREVHDGLGHALVSIILRLELCVRLIRRAPDEAEAILKEEIPALRAAWNEGRDMAFHLRPWEAEVSGSGGLPETLRLHIARFAERTGLAVTFQAEGDGNKLRSSVAYGLTRIVQEALTNAAKHSEARRIEVSLTFPRSGRLTCAICDDGKGFAQDASRAGFGLQAMRERAESLGGALSVESAPDCGTKIIVTIPN